MKVAIICAAGIVSGKERMALELGEGLRAKNVEVHFVTSRWGTGEFAKRTQAAGFSTCRLWLGFISATLRLDCIWMTFDQLRRWPALLLGYRRFLKSACPDKIIHTNWHHVLLLWPFLRPERDIYWLHELIPDKPQYRRLFQRMSGRVECLVAVSQASAKSLHDLGVLSTKVRVIYNGIDDPTLGDGQRNENVGSTIGIVGQIGAWKGHEDLLEAFQVVLQTLPEAKLHIFGEGSHDYEAFLHRRASVLGVGGHVIWHGFIGDRSTIYRELAVLVVPSRFEEPFGLTAIEAAFYEIPVIASARGGLAEIVKDGVTGFLFEVGDIAALARHLVVLLKDSDLRTGMGGRARNRAQSLFSRERFVRDFMDVLDRENVMPG